MNETMQKTVIELATLGLDYHEHNTGKLCNDERHALEQAKLATGLFFLPTPQLNGTPRANGSDDVFALYKDRMPTPEAMQQVRQKPREWVLVSKCVNNNDAFRIRKKWITGGFLAKTVKDNGEINVMAAWGLPK